MTSDQRSTTPTLDALFSSTHHALLRLRKRQYMLDHLEGRMTELLGSGTRTYKVYNDIVYSMILSFDDKNVIDFASWTKALYSSGGLLRTLRAHHLAAFPAKRHWQAQDEDEQIARSRDEAYANARKRWFPAAEARLMPIDISILQTHFQATVESLQNDRNENRAHIFEKAPGRVKELALAEMRALYEDAHAMLNDLRLLALGSTFVGVNLIQANTEETVDDLLEMMCLPQYARIALRGAGISTADFLDSLSRTPALSSTDVDVNTTQAIDLELSARGLPHADDGDA